MSQPTFSGALRRSGAMPALTVPMVDIPLPTLPPLIRPISPRCYGGRLRTVVRAAKRLAHRRGRHARNRGLAFPLALALRVYR